MKIQKHDYNIPCWGCKHHTDLAPDNCPHGFVVAIPDDWMAEPSDCERWSGLDAGISVTESLGRRLFD